MTGFVRRAEWTSPNLFSSKEECPEPGHSSLLILYKNFSLTLFVAAFLGLKGWHTKNREEESGLSFRLLQAPILHATLQDARTDTDTG